jgi:hypothetical protein
MSPHAREVQEARVDATRTSGQIKHADAVLRRHLYDNNTATTRVVTPAATLAAKYLDEADQLEVIAAFETYFYRERCLFAIFFTVLYLPVSVVLWRTSAPHVGAKCASAALVIGASGAALASKASSSSLARGVRAVRMSGIGVVLGVIASVLWSFGDVSAGPVWPALNPAVPAWALPAVGCITSWLATRAVELHAREIARLKSLMYAHKGL